MVLYLSCIVRAHSPKFAVQIWPLQPEDLLFQRFPSPHNHPNCMFRQKLEFVLSDFCLIHEGLAN